LSIDYDRMMALMLRNAIYLFDVCLLAMLFDRAACALRLGEVGRGHPQKSLIACSQCPRASLCEKSSQ